MRQRVERSVVSGVRISVNTRYREHWFHRGGETASVARFCKSALQPIEGVRQEVSKTGDDHNAVRTVHNQENTRAVFHPVRFYVLSPSACVQA